MHYTLTIDDVLPEMHTSKYFSIIDAIARSGYWIVPLDNRSQLLTTFNIFGFGRCCLKSSLSPYTICIHNIKLISETWQANR